MFVRIVCLLIGIMFTLVFCIFWRPADPHAAQSLSVEPTGNSTATEFTKPGAIQSMENSTAIEFTKPGPIKPMESSTVIEFTKPGPIKPVESSTAIKFTKPGAIKPMGTTTAKEFTNQAPQYSKHDCRTLTERSVKPCDSKLTSLYSRRSCVLGTVCRLENVCYNLAEEHSSKPPFTRRLIYFAEASNRAPFGDRTTFFEKGTVALDVVSKPIPEHTLFRHDVAVLFDVYKCGNFGHNIRDVMFYVYLMLYMFEIVDPFNSQFLTLSDRCSARSALQVPHCLALPALYGMLSRHPLLQLQSSHLREKHNGSDDLLSLHHSQLMCFRTLLVGSGAQNRNYWHGKGGWSFVSKQYFSYRNFIIYNVLAPHCADIACGAKVTNLSRITVLMKGYVGLKSSSGAGIRNAENVSIHLAEKFPKYIVQARDFSKLSLSQQMSWAIETVVMFTHVGGGSYIALFLSPHATCAIMTTKIAEEPAMFKQRFLWMHIVFLPNTGMSLRSGLHLRFYIAERITRAALTNSGSGNLSAYT